MLKLIGLHKEPYNAKDCSIFIRADKIFTMSQVSWKRINNYLSNVYDNIELKFTDEKNMDLNTGGLRHILLLETYIRKYVKSPIEDKLEEKIAQEKESLNSTRGIISHSYENFMKFSHNFFERTNELIDWKEVSKRYSAGISIINKN